MKSLRFIPAAFLLISIISCSPELQNLAISKQEVQEYYESGKYDKEMQSIINDAEKQIENMQIADNSAAVFDIDETCLSNYPHIKSTSFGFETNAWQAWIKSAKAPAIKETKELYDLLVKKGVHIIFITGRTQNDLVYTKNNLESQGFVKYDTLICRNDNELKLTAQVYKTAHRKSLTENNKYNIIMCVGDQWSDLEGGYAGITVKLPDYLYLIK